MGRDAFVHIPKTVSRKSIEELLLRFDFVKNKSMFYCGNDREYKFFSGVSCWFEKPDDNGDHVIWIRTVYFSSEYDVFKQNDTIRILKRYFKAWFVSDNGRNRYFEVGKLTKGVENGCYYAIQKLDNHFGRLKHSLSLFPKDSEQISILREFGVPTPETVNSNIYISFLCSIIEEYFRETYIAILRYSQNKEKVIDYRFSIIDLLAIESGEKSVEEVYARTLSFQNIKKISNNFRRLDSKIEIDSILRKPYKRRKLSLYDQIDFIFERRHKLIHSIEFDLDYSTDKILKDIDDIKASFIRVYKYICKQKGWVPMDIVI